ncbi:sugar ABC transporter permease [Schaalia sp. 19OD2882]|uniref:carbohydrate ABC transporter permease n=1 Tax=Schaalia sp. 19OD2882 TaxID=2794089 RepID=UPI001C1ED111|nr:sugar ABC transporter permease [Schaalia sp. 19OD2882]QWW20192.1 sugar ABC transporter permease [Schaalia sp. 19OD2882]
MNKKTDRIQWDSYLFLLPAAVLFFVFVAYPIVYNFQASLLEWDGINEATPVGLDNYAALADDPTFALTLRNSALWILLTVVPQSVIGFLMALLLNTELKGRIVYRTLFFVPVVISPIVIGIVWQRLLDPFRGVTGAIAHATGWEWFGQNFLGSPDTAIFTVIVINVWQWSGYSMLFYLAGLQQIDASLLEAARIDGASYWRTVRSIILPLLKPTHLSLVLLSVIGSLKTFELVYATTKGGPNHASEMIPTYTFLKAFELQSVGSGAALSIVLIALAVVSALVLVVLFGAGFISGSHDEASLLTRVLKRRRDEEA